MFSFALALPAVESAARPRGRQTSRAACADRREFAIRGAGDRGAPRGSRGGNRPRRRAGRGPRRARRRPPPDLVIVDCALGAEATNRLASAARAAGAPKSLVLFSPFERRAFGQTSLGGFDGWLVKPVRARSLFERLASEFPSASGATSAQRVSVSRAGARAPRRGQRNQRDHRSKGAASARVRGDARQRRRRGGQSCRGGGARRSVPVRSRRPWTSGCLASTAMRPRARSARSSAICASGAWRSLR